MLIALQIIEYRGSESAERMERLNQNMKQEAVVVRIITLVTLLYLPATFVSTFFSTDIIKYDEDPNGTFSHSAMNRWLQITLPLTFITLSVAWLAKTWADRKALGTEMEFEVKSGSVMQNLRRWVQPSGLFNVAAKQSALPLLPVSNPSRSVAPLAKSTP
jgi:hypothetical protein